MRKPDDAPAVRRDLHRHAFAHAAEAAELVMRELLEIPADRGRTGRVHVRLRGLQVASRC